jgi:6-phospho-3-hexuloisomerase
MPNTSPVNVILEELHSTAALISEQAVENLIAQILQAEKIFVAGAGRSGLMMRAFAMRMMHMGLQAYVVGESTTPGLTSRDLLIIGSGSGETKSLVSMADKAASLKAAIALATVTPESTIGRIADTVIQVPAAAKEKADGITTIQPMGSLFEQSLLLLFDGIILNMMNKSGMSSSDMFSRHANLE